MSFHYELYHLVSSPPTERSVENPDGRDDGTHININETIDGSVFKRWRAIRTIVRPTCSNGPNAKKVDPAQLQTSCKPTILTRRCPISSSRSVARSLGNVAVVQRNLFNHLKSASFT